MARLTLAAALSYFLYEAQVSVHFSQRSEPLNVGHIG